MSLEEWRPDDRAEKRDVILFSMTKTGGLVRHDIWNTLTQGIVKAPCFYLKSIALKDGIWIDVLKKEQSWDDGDFFAICEQVLFHSNTDFEDRMNYAAEGLLYYADKMLLSEIKRSDIPSYYNWKESEALVGSIVLRVEAVVCNAVQYRSFWLRHYSGLLRILDVYERIPYSAIMRGLNLPSSPKNKSISSRLGKLRHDGAVDRIGASGAINPVYAIASREIFDAELARHAMKPYTLDQKNAVKERARLWKQTDEYRSIKTAV